MATGKRLITNIDNGGWACFKIRDKSSRDRCSDRMKRIRKNITKKCRTSLKRQLQNELLKLEE